jgi:hypothetical protein
MEVFNKLLQISAHDFIIFKTFKSNLGEAYYVHSVTETSAAGSVNANRLV